MKACDLIEANEEPLEVILPLDTDAELMDHFKIYHDEDHSSL